jgi:hypothetical protein
MVKLLDQEGEKLTAEQLKNIKNIFPQDDFLSLLKKMGQKNE